MIERAQDHPLCSHGGVGKTLRRLKNFFFWPKITSQIREYVLSCETCKQTKAPNQTLRPLMGDQVVSERVFQRLNVDLLGPYPRSRAGHVGLFIVVDHKSKFVVVEPIKKLAADVIAKFLEHRIFYVFSVPEVIVSDNGVQFKSQIFQRLLQKYGIAQMLVSE